ncbi:hypothetical protein U9M48_021498 [Paspalum notatum var. saurae]|uniref:Ubiquitin-like protease family profile domain-containing protein n=1 Tax=Paspalum notatum var. saurae TaxID=547442 RepID=A0AAQ3TFS2_PASNO
MGDQDVPTNLLESPTPPAEVKDALKSALRAASKKDGQWSLKDVIEAYEQAKSRDDHMLQVRLYIAAVFEFGIFTSSSNYLSAENLGHVYDIQELVKTDWCKKLIDHMQKCLKTFDETKRVFSPLIFTLFVMENIDWPLPDDMKTPRMIYYTEGQFRDIVAAFKKGVKLKDWKNTVFGRNDIAEVQASEIKYAENYKQAVRKRKVLKEVKDPSRVLKETKGVSKKRPKRDEKSTDDSNKHDQFFRADIDRDILHFYKENVVEKTRDKIVLNILNHEVSEMNYVECFKKKGYMHTSIMFLQCALWNEEWKEKTIDKVILSYMAMLELSGQKEGHSTLDDELLTGDLELKANLIFIPIVHDHHWFLIVISREKTIYILDSFHSKSREPVICRILTTLKQLLGSDYISKVLEVQQQKNSYDCGFHVLLYINGFDDKKTEKICGVNKDMVERCRIETSVHLRRHKLNKPAEVIIDDDDVDDLEVLEDRYSYENCIFNAALRGEEVPTPSFMDRTGTFLHGFGMENLADGTNMEVLGNSTALLGEGEYREINVDGADMDTSKLESNVDGKEETGNTADIDKSKLESNVDGKEETGNTADMDKSKLESNVDGKMQHYKRKQIKMKPSKAQQPEDSSAVILKYEHISMTGLQLEKCLQGGPDAKDVIIILMEFLDPMVKDMRRIFVSPLEKDDEHLEEKIRGALPFSKNTKTRTTAISLTNTIIYFPVFFSGEWIVVCFVFSTLKNQIHIFCHNNSFEEVRKFSLTMGEILSKAVKEHTSNAETFSQERVARTRSTIKANDSAAASMYFLENFFTPRQVSQFSCFEMECDKTQDEFVKRIKFGLVQYLLGQKKNKGKVPATVLELLGKKKENLMN